MHAQTLLLVCFLVVQGAASVGFFHAGHAEHMLQLLAPLSL